MKKNNNSPLEDFAKHVSVAKREVNQLVTQLQKRMNKLTLDDVLSSLNPNRFKCKNPEGYRYETEHYMVDVSHNYGFYCLYVHVEGQSPIGYNIMLGDILFGFAGNKYANHPKIEKFYKEVEKAVEKDR